MSDDSLCHVRDFFFQAEDGIRDRNVTGVQTCALPIVQRRVRAALPSNPQTWLALGEFDLARLRSGGGAQGGAHAALNELGAAIYLNPELIAPAAIAAGNREAIAAQNAYVEALRAGTPPARAPLAPGPSRPAAGTAARRPAGALAAGQAARGTPTRA